jgi:uncharacterized protein
MRRAREAGGELSQAAQDLIDRLELAPHPEGGWYRETHRSATSNASGRSICTSILFLLEHPHVSHLHRLDAEELWFWHAGDALDVQVVTPDGLHETRRLGPGGNFQTMIPVGTWFGAELPNPESWALVGCAVTPAFEFAGFEMACREDLARQYPLHRELITRLT